MTIKDFIVQCRPNKLPLFALAYIYVCVYLFVPDRKSSTIYICGNNVSGVLFLIVVKFAIWLLTVMESNYILVKS